jgi:hypothetical protein
VPNVRLRYPTGGDARRVMHFLDHHRVSGENRPLTRLDARALYRRILRRDSTKLIRRDAHFFGEVSEPLAKFFHQSLNVGEMVLDGLEATGGGVFHDGIISEG